MCGGGGVVGPGYTTRPPSSPDDPTNPVNLLLFNDTKTATDTTGRDLVGVTRVPDGYNYRSCCYESVGTDTLTITGLLATDTVEVPVGSATPVLSSDTVNFSAGLKYWELTIKRSGVVIGFYTCGEGAGDYAINSIVDSVIGNGEISTTDINVFHSKLTDGTGYDQNVNGLTVSNGATYYYDDSQVLLIPEGVYIPPAYEVV